MSDSLFSMVIMLSPLISRMLNLHTPIIKHHHHHCLQFVWHNMPYQWQDYTFWAGHNCIAFSQPSLNLSCSFAVTARVSIFLSIWITYWSWFTLSRHVRRLTHFSALYWFSLDYILIFPGVSSASLSFFLVFRESCWDTVHMSVSLPPDKLADIQQLALSLLQTQVLLQSVGSCPF